MQRHASGHRSGSPIVHRTALFLPVTESRAVRRDPNSARALAVLGFVQLAELRSARALDTFRLAVQSDPGLPLARLGYGLALMRRGELAGGRDLRAFRVANEFLNESD